MDIPEGLMDKIDKTRKGYYNTREDYIRQKIRDGLKADEELNAYREKYRHIPYNEDKAREKITIDPGDMKTTVTIPAGLRTYLEKYKKDNETYGEELVRLLNED